MQSGAERQATYEGKQRERGLVRKSVWIPKEAAAQFDEFVAALKKQYETKGETYYGR